LRHSEERYRGLLEASPGAVVLYDAGLRVTEWNASAERLYGFSKAEVVANGLPTVPKEKEAELRGFLQRVVARRPVLNVETLRRNKQGNAFEIELGMLPFREPGAK